MSEYKIKSIIKDEPRTWEGPNGTIYYIGVMLEGHDKPVSIGKKSPDALKAGDTVTGKIIPTDFPDDKFKADPFPQRSGLSPQERAKTEAERSRGMREGMCYNNAANYVQSISVKNMSYSPDEWADKVYEYAQALYAKGDLKVNEQIEAVFNK